MLYLNKRQTRALKKILKKIDTPSTNKRHQRHLTGLKQIVKSNLIQQKTRQGQMTRQEINHIWDY